MAHTSFAQDSTGIHFTYTTSRIASTIVALQIHAKIPEGIKLYSVKGNEQKLAEEGYGYDPDVVKFVAHLEQVRKKFDK